jgi:O-antigen/teichoic acid export membrane protein
MGTATQLAWYSAAQRLLWPLPILLTAIGATFYPVLSARWPQDRAGFEQVCQTSFNAAFVLCGLAGSSLLAGGVFFLRLLGKDDLTAGAEVLRILVFLCFAKAVGASLGPALFTLRAQNAALALVTSALAAKAVLVSVLTPKVGYLGVAYGSLAVETTFSALPAFFLLKQKAGYMVELRTPVAAVVLTAVCGLTPVVTGAPPLVGALLAPVAYCGLVLALGLVKPGQIRQMLRRQLA